MENAEMKMKLLDPGIYYGGESIPEGDYYLVYPENSEAYIEVQVEKEDGTYTSFIMSDETPRTHLHVKEHYSFIVSHQVGIVISKHPSIFL